MKKNTTKETNSLLQNKGKGDAHEFSKESEKTMKSKKEKKMNHETMVKEIQRVIDECDGGMLFSWAEGIYECMELDGIEESDLYDYIYRSLAMDKAEPIFDAIKEDLGVECAEYWRNHASDFTQRQGGDGYHPHDVSYVDEIYANVKDWLEHERKPLTKEIVKSFVREVKHQMDYLGKVFVENLESNKRGYSEMAYLGELSEKRTLGYTLVKAKIDKDRNVLLKIRKSRGDETSNLDDDLIETLCKVAA